MTRVYLLHAARGLFLLCQWKVHALGCHPDVIWALLSDTTNLKVDITQIPDYDYIPGMSHHSMTKPAPNFSWVYQLIIHFHYWETIPPWDANQKNTF